MNIDLIFKQTISSVKPVSKILAEQRVFIPGEVTDLSASGIRDLITAFIKQENILSLENVELYPENVHHSLVQLTDEYDPGAPINRAFDISMAVLKQFGYEFMLVNRLEYEEEVELPLDYSSRTLLVANWESNPEGVGCFYTGWGMVYETDDIDVSAIHLLPNLQLEKKEEDLLGIKTTVDGYEQLVRAEMTNDFNDQPIIDMFASYGYQYLVLLK